MRYTVCSAKPEFKCYCSAIHTVYILRHMFNASPNIRLEVRRSSSMSKYVEGGEGEGLVPLSL